MRSPTGADAVPLSRQLISELASAAMMAPSVHYTQPWRIQVNPQRQTIGLHANPDGQVEDSDPTGRIVHLACGAAVFNLRIAAAVAGREPMVMLLPEPAAPSLLATIRLAGAHYTRPGERELNAAMIISPADPRLHGGRRVRDATFVQLADAACGEGATLHILDDAARIFLLELARNAGGSDAALLGGSAQLAVLATTVWDAADGLRAGQAMQRVLLTATARGIAASAFVPLLDADCARQLMGDWCGTGQPQVILRFGGAPAPPDHPAGSGEDTPRRLPGYARYDLVLLPIAGLARVR